MKNYFNYLYVLSFATLVIACGSSKMVAKSDIKTTEAAAIKAKKEYIEQTNACKSCEITVKNDKKWGYGQVYNKLFEDIKTAEVELKDVETRYAAGLRMFQTEAERLNYHGKEGIKLYQERKAAWESDMNSEKSGIFITLIDLYKQLKELQISSYNAIVEHKALEAKDRAVMRPARRTSRPDTVHRLDTKKDPYKLIDNNGREIQEIPSDAYFLGRFVNGKLIRTEDEQKEIDKEEKELEENRKRAEEASRRWNELRKERAKNNRANNTKFRPATR